ncbi:glycosyltransferase family 2 protein [Phocaeicola sartorii]|jgi:glycosyltransferase involved in cell wall biosynthesis|uniref:glycosyltransferase family 2 protein n=1 Tax=Phocaeicola sartorii TaxID=671267 RepID=UPI0025863319|nr:glycosyltransferase family 2 protein [Phocaeicola sartorii]
MEHVFLSIVIATYNAKATLARCLDSIILQKNKEIELVIIDGGSQDGTIEIIKRYEKYVTYWKSEPDNGIYDAWNKAIIYTKGKWIEFIGSDDIVLPNSLNEYMEYVKKHNIEDVDIVTAKIRIVNEKGKFLQSKGEPFVWNKCRKFMVSPHPSIWHARKLFEEVGLYDISYRSAGDTELLYRKGAKIKSLFFDKEIVQFQIGGTSSSSLGLKEAFRCRKQHKTVDLYTNIFFYLRGVLSLFMKKILWK